jgi:uncharacterized protein
MSKILATLILLPLMLLALYGFGRWLAYQSMFHPYKYPSGPWHVQEQVGAQDVWLTGADGVKTHAWWVPREDAEFAILFLHGNAGNLSHRGLHLRALPAAGASVLALDYRGFGKSEGRPSEAGLYRDADAAFEWLIQQGFSKERIVLHGESLGGAVAVHTAAHRGCGGLVLEGAFSSAADVAGGIIPIVGPLLVKEFNSVEKIGRVDCPVLMIHGGNDTVIEDRHARKLFEAANPPKEFWSLPGASHEDVVVIAGDQYVRRLGGFLESLGAMQQP